MTFWEVEIFPMSHLLREVHYMCKLFTKKWPWNVSFCTFLQLPALRTCDFLTSVRSYAGCNTEEWNDLAMKLSCVAKLNGMYAINFVRIWCILLSFLSIIMSIHLRYKKNHTSFSVRSEHIAMSYYSRLSTASSVSLSQKKLSDINSVHLPCQ